MPGRPGGTITPIERGWQVARAEPGQQADPGTLSWLDAAVPGTAAGAMRAAGRWQPGRPLDFDASDWWFRARFDADRASAGERMLLHLDGVATVFDAWLNGVPMASGTSMWARHVADVSELLAGPGNELLIRCQALGPLLDVPRRPRARWRAMLAANQLRWYRTTLLGRAPGFAPGPAPVGPWRPVWLERRSGPVAAATRLRARLDGTDGVLAIRLWLDDADAGGPDLPGSVLIEVSGPGRPCTERAVIRDRQVAADIRLPGVIPWWPHTLGLPACYDVRISAGGTVLHTATLGFRNLRSQGEIEVDGIDLAVNGAAVFCRGAVWTPPEAVSLAPAEGSVRQALIQARNAGMNMIRIPGTGCYESGEFFGACAELGLLVWQDLMFANFDYPLGNPAFAAQATSEVTSLLDDIGSRPCLAVLCGNSEVEQQAAMLGQKALDPGGFFRGVVPGLIKTADVDAIYVPSAPCGGDLPFRSGRGIASYFGVGGYRRDVGDARRAGVRFAAECLAFANVPDDEVTRPLGPPGGPGWKAGVPSDPGASWDFDDVRDHYFAALFGLDPAALRQADPDRYLRLSRVVTGEVMAAVFGEWRRAGSPTRGGLVLWLRDLAPGAGWGLLDSEGRPKAAWFHLRRVLAPVAVWTTDEGLDGIAVHVANDEATALAATLRLAGYADGERLVLQATRAVTVPPRSVASWDAEALIGHFFDAALAYKFGPPGHDTIAVTLLGPGNLDDPLGQAFSFPAGLPVDQQTAEQLGLRASARPAGDGVVEVRLRCRRLVYGLRVRAPNLVPDDDSITLEPGRDRVLTLRAVGPAKPGRLALTAVNLDATLPVPVCATAGFPQLPPGNPATSSSDAAAW